MEKNASEPLVSIACITYNQENYIRQCLDGFVMQKTNFKFEIVIHDDASTDKTPSIIKEYCDKYPNLFVPILQSQNKYKEGKGILVPYVFPRCKGKYIALCEGDDYWIDPLKLQKQVDFLDSHLDCGLVHSMCNYIDSKNQIIDYENLPLLYKKIDAKKSVGYIYGKLFNNPSSIMTCTIMFRSDVLFNQDPKGIDHAIFMSAAKKYKIAFINQCFSAYRIHSHSIMRTDYDNVQNCLFEVISTHMKNYYNKSHFENMNPYYRQKKELRHDVDLFFSKYVTHQIKKGIRKCDIIEILKIVSRNPRLLYLTIHNIYIRMLKK